ncbi:MAG: AtpZ/AtpI family protein [Acetobacteraceae bacterium]
MTEEPGSSDRSFEERLKAARGRRGLDAPAKRPDDSGGLGMSPWGIGLRVGLELVAAMVVAVAIGYGLDRLFGTTPILMAVFVPLGGAAGVMNVWRLLSPKPADSSATGRTKAVRSKTGDKQGG